MHERCRKCTLNQHVGGCQNDGPLLGPVNTSCCIILRTPKRDHNLDNHPCNAFTLEDARRLDCQGYPFRTQETAFSLVHSGKDTFLENFLRPRTAATLQTPGAPKFLNPTRSTPQACKPQLRNAYTPRAPEAPNTLPSQGLAAFYSPQQGQLQGIQTLAAFFGIFPTATICSLFALAVIWSGHQ